MFLISLFLAFCVAMGAPSLHVVPIPPQADPTTVLSLGGGTVGALDEMSDDYVVITVQVPIHREGERIDIRAPDLVLAAARAKTA